MASYVIADLHLSLSQPDKSMDAFGAAWKDYQEKLKQEWLSCVREGDTVVVPGDLSWAGTLDEALPDFEFLNALPGRKILLKGNHDFYWSSLKKMKEFCANHGFNTFSFLQNDALVLEDPGVILCGTRGWFFESSAQPETVRADFDKVFNRELIRLRLSLEAGRKLRQAHGLPIVCCLHFPPAFGDVVCKEFMDLLVEYGVKSCYFGHVHGRYQVPLKTFVQGIRLYFIAADYLKFRPCLLEKPD